MNRFRLSPDAVRDIEGMVAYIARHSAPAARQVRQALLAACRRLAEYPGMGHRREDLTDKPVRFFPVYTFLIVYNPVTTPLEIVRVLGGAQDIAAMLARDP
jgi:toxin ParE1/3/4